MNTAVNEKKLRYMEYIHRETASRHHTNTEDMYQYDLLRMGDPRAVDVGRKMFSPELTGHISDDPLRNYKYLFVASITLASRSAIAGGMDAERAYNISDLYILKMDALQTVEEVKALHTDMFAFYTREMAALDKAEVYSKPVILCMDYIYNEKPKDAAAPVSNPKLTIVDLRAFVAARSTPENRPKIKAILTKYGVKKLTELQESQYSLSHTK